MACPTCSTPLAETGHGKHGATDSTPTSVEHLLAELVEKFEAALSRGEQPDIDDYCARHPEIEDPLRQALTVSARLARATSGRVGAVLDLDPMQRRLQGGTTVRLRLGLVIRP